MAETTSGPGEFFAGLVQDHERFEAHLKALLQAADALTKTEGRSADLDVIVATLRFFATDGAHHEDIEERTLFPRIRHLPEFKQILSAIEFQHRMNRTAADELGAGVERYSPGHGRELRHLAIRFAEMHRGHAVAEERALFPLAASVLPPQVLDEMCRESRARKRPAGR